MTWPGPDEVAIDKATADKEDFAIGKVIGVQGDGPVERLRISGIFRFGSVSTIGGATLAGFDLPTAQQIFDKAGKLDEIAVAAEPGVSETEVVQEIENVLPPTAEVKLASEQAEEDAADTNEFITFLQGFLLAFAGIALFVGSFVIANSLSITIAQRTREFATIRTLGGSRRQVLGSIVIESLVVGTVASIIGLVSGLALAKGLFKLFDVVGFTLPNQGLLLETRTIVVSLLVGDPRHAHRQPPARDPGDPCAPDRGRARGCDAARVPLCTLPHRRVAGADSARLRRARLRALRQRPRDDRGPALDGHRRAPDLHRRRALLRPARPAAREACSVRRRHGSVAPPGSSRGTTPAGTLSEPLPPRRR